MTNFNPDDFSPIIVGREHEFYAEMQQAEMPEHERMRNYTGQTVTVTSGPLPKDDDEGSNLFKVRAADGREFEAFEEELSGWNKALGQYFWADGTYGPKRDQKYLGNEKKQSQYASGEWTHLFGAGSKETRCRIAIDLGQSKLVAAQEWTGLKFEDVLGERLKDLAESVIEVNEAHTNLGDWCLELTTEMPEWATQREVETTKQDQNMKLIVARIEADIALLRQTCDEPVSIKFSDKIDIEVRPAEDDDRVLVGRAGWGCTVVNYTSEGLILDVYNESDLESVHTACINESDLETSLPDELSSHAM